MSGISNLPCGGSKLETDDFIMYSFISSEATSGTEKVINIDVGQNISRIILSISGMLIKMYYNLSTSKEVNVGGQIILYDSNDNKIAEYDRRGYISLGQQENTKRGLAWNETHEINKYVKKIYFYLVARETQTTQYTNASCISVVLIKQK